MSRDIAHICLLGLASLGIAVDDIGSSGPMKTLRRRVVPHFESDKPLSKRARRRLRGKGVQPPSNTGSPS